MLVQFVTGHNFLRYHQYKIGKAQSKSCRLCGVGIETSEHIVWKCATLARSLLNFWVDPSIVIQRTESLLKFLTENVLHLLRPAT